MRWLALFCVFLAVPAAAQPTGDRDIFLPQVTQEALANKIPPEIADAVAMVETGYRPNAVGTSGEIGIMQILPSTAAALGFHGSVAELFAPSINIHLAVQYLARAWADSGGDMCRAFTKYRAGVGTEVTTPLSAQYCARAIAWLKGTNSQLAATAAATAPAAASSDPIDDPHVIRMVPIPVSTMGRLPVITTPQSFQPSPPGQMSASQLSRLESRVRAAVNGATSGDPND